MYVHSFHLGFLLRPCCVVTKIDSGEVSRFLPSVQVGALEDYDTSMEMNKDSLCTMIYFKHDSV